jgi:hypothetical protein
MPSRMIVMVADNEDGKRGEITVLDDPHKAEVLIETLLEAGFEQGRIRLYSGDQTDIQVNYRPVVALVNDEGSAPTAEEIAPLREPMVVGARTAPAPAPEPEEEAVPFVKDGVRFSSLFQSADITKIPTAQS